VVNAPVLKPLLAVPTEPFQTPVPVSPLPVHAVALLVDQDNDAAWPDVMLVGDMLNAVMLAAGCGTLVTLTTTELGLPAPPGPVQLKVKV